MRLHGSLALAALLAVACKEPLPPLDAEGEHVRVGAEVVPEVCEGTLVHLDAELERVAAELELEPPSTPIDVYVLDSEALSERCPVSRGSCWQGWERTVYVNEASFERAIIHELVHALVEPTDAGDSKQLFQEGIASAFQRQSCPPTDDFERPSPDELLEAEIEGTNRTAMYYFGGELLRWLLETHGPGPVLAFMASVRVKTPADEVRDAYLDAFGTAFDDDLYAHLREQDHPLSASDGTPVLESCLLFEFACEPGLICEANDAYEGCSSDGWLQLSGCCAPLCDPGLADPQCPQELPSCEAEADGSIGVCRP